MAAIDLLRTESPNFILATEKVVWTFDRLWHADPSGACATMKSLALAPTAKARTGSDQRRRIENLAPKPDHGFSIGLCDFTCEEV
jgi:hypothetical protein